MKWFSNYLDFTIKPKLAIPLILGFVVFTVIGTLTHELGHIAFAKAQGCTTTLRYGYMTYNQEPVPEDIARIAKVYHKEINQRVDFPEKDRWEAVRKQGRNLAFWVSFDGPFQTTVFGTLGILVLFQRRGSIKVFGLKRVDWLWVFFSLFWLREVYNPVYAFISGSLRGDFNP